MNILSWFQFFYFSGGHIRKKIKSDEKYTNKIFKKSKRGKKYFQYIYLSKFITKIDFQDHPVFPGWFDMESPRVKTSLVHQRTGQFISLK